jgi:hypothetical protein
VKTNTATKNTTLFFIPSSWFREIKKPRAVRLHDAQPSWLKLAVQFEGEK